MSRLVTIPGSAAATAPTKLSGYSPALGVAGYNRRLKATSYAALGAGATITTGWPNLIDTNEVSTVGGAPLRNTVAGKPAINCVSSALADLTFPGAMPISGTIFVVFSGYNGGGNMAVAWNVVNAAGRQLVRASDRWKLYNNNGADIDSISVLHTAVPYVVDRLMIAVVGLSQDGVRDTLRIVGGGADQSVSGKVTTSVLQSPGLRFGKIGGGTGIGAQYFEAVTFPDRILSTAEQNAVIASLKATYGVS